MIEGVSLKMDMDKYEVWIKENITDDVYGKCSEYTLKMQEIFPELKRVRGHYHCPIWGKREHWWLIINDSTEQIIDPTVKQFPSHMLNVEYEPWIEGSKEPTGKCPNCGNHCFDHSFCCSETCKSEYKAYLNSFR